MRPTTMMQLRHFAILLFFIIIFSCICVENNMLHTSAFAREIIHWFTQELDKEKIKHIIKTKEAVLICFLLMVYCFCIACVYGRQYALHNNVFVSLDTTQDWPKHTSTYRGLNVSALAHTLLRLYCIVEGAGARDRIHHLFLASSYTWQKEVVKMFIPGALDNRASV